MKRVAAFTKKLDARPLVGVALLCTFLLFLAYYDAPERAGAASSDSPETPEPADGTVSYSLGWFNFWNDPMDTEGVNFNVNAGQTDGEFTWGYDNGSGTMLRFRGLASVGDEYGVINSTQMPWYTDPASSFLQFWYSIAGTGTHTLEVWVTTGLNAVVRIDTLNSGSGVKTYPLFSYGPNTNQFRVHFKFIGTNQLSVILLEDVHVYTPEFIIRENGGVGSDTIEYDQSMTIDAYIVPVPSHNGWPDTEATTGMVVDTSPSFSSPTYVSMTRVSVQHYQLTIPASSTTWGNTYYYKVNYSDSSWRSSPRCDFQVVDTTAPSVSGIQSPGSTPYDQPVFINFTASDGTPYLGQSLIDPSSFLLTTGVQDLGAPYFTNTGGDNWQVWVPETVFAWSDTQLTCTIGVRDNAGNPYNTSSFSISITDPYDPSMSQLETNATSVEYTDSVYVDVTLDDHDPDASLINRAYLFVKSGSAPSHSNGNPGMGTTRVSANVSVGGQLNVRARFLIGSTNLQAGERLYWELWVEDAADNEVYGSSVGFNGSFYVDDLVAPSISLYEIMEYIDTDGQPGKISYDEDARVTWYVTEPSNALGFWGGDNGTVVMYYQVGAQPSNGSATHATGVVSPGSWFSNPDVGGLISFVIPESEYTTGDTVWVWVNASDRRYPDSNDASSFSTTLLWNFTVYDLKAPEYQSLSFPDVNYYEDQQVRFRLYKKPGEGSWIDNFTVYVRKNNSTVNPSNYDFKFFYDDNNWSSVLSVVSGTLDKPFVADVALEFLHDQTNYDFRWNDQYYFYLETWDAASNTRTETSRSFRVRDGKAPSVTQAEDNTYGVIKTDGKVLSVDVSDPDFAGGYASGIGAVYLYVKNQSTQVSVSDYTFMLSNTSVPAEGGTIQFTISTGGLNVIDFVEMAYIFVVEDRDGAIRTTTPQTFTVHLQPGIKVLSPAGLTYGQKFYTNQISFEVVVNLSFPCQAWYSLDGGSIQSLGFSAETTRTITLSLSSERTYVLNIYYYDTSHFVTYEVVLDVTPPPAVTQLQASHVSDHVSIEWNAVPDVNPIYYRVYRSETEPDPSNPATWGDCIKGCGESEFSSTQYSDYAILQGKTYYYTVVAVDVAGNVSVASTVEVSVPVPNWIWVFVALIGGAVGVGVVLKVRSGRERAVISKALSRAPEDAGLADEELDAFAKAAQKRKAAKIETTAAGTQWTSITVGHKAKPTGPPRLPPARYWASEVKELTTRAVELESEGKVAQAMRRWEVLLRAAERTGNVELQAVARGRLRALQESGSGSPK
ncbi:MAG: hypothetical protein Kow0069_00360 [Promethearchaeota archaeon]